MIVEMNAKKNFLYRHAACCNYSLNNRGIFKTLIQVLRLTSNRLTHTPSILLLANRSVSTVPAATCGAVSSKHFGHSRHDAWCRVS